MPQVQRKFNSYEFEANMMRILDQQAIATSTTGWMEPNSSQVQYDGSRDVKIPTMSTDGLADYDRDEGYVRGGISLRYDSYTMTQDRGKQFFLDAMDVNESNFIMNAQNAMMIFQQEHVIPEIDSYRYSKIANIAETVGQNEAVALTADNALSKLREHIRGVQDVIGIESQLIITMPSNVLALLEDSPKIGKSINPADFSQGGINLRIRTLDGNPIVVVPSSRLKTSYDIMDGTSSGQEKGGLKPSAGAKDIQWLITPRNVPIAITKQNKVQVFTPQEVQDADGWKINYRRYHDLWVKKQKDNQIFVCTTA